MGWITYIFFQKKFSSPKNIWRVCNIYLQTADWEQKTKISNWILTTSLFIDQSESTVLQFKCRGKFFVEAPKPQIESLKNQIGASKWFVWLYILRVSIAYDVLYIVKGPNLCKHWCTIGSVAVLTSCVWPGAY